jgi:hypothetical protein
MVSGVLLKKLGECCLRDRTMRLVLQEEISLIMALHSGEAKSTKSFCCFHSLPRKISCFLLARCEMQSAWQLCAIKWRERCKEKIKKSN